MWRLDLSQVFGIGAHALNMLARVYSCCTSTYVGEQVLHTHVDVLLLVSNADVYRSIWLLMGNYRISTSDLFKLNEDDVSNQAEISEATRIKYFWRSHRPPYFISQKGRLHAFYDHMLTNNRLEPKVEDFYVKCFQLHSNWTRTHCTITHP